MKIIENPQFQIDKNILQRPVFEMFSLIGKVKPIMDKIKNDGDSAIIEFNRIYDNFESPVFLIQKSELEQIAQLCSLELKSAIRQASENIKKFHSAQVSENKLVETMSGVRCWQKTVPIQKVGLYIPGGSAPLFSTVLMLAIPAKLAGCSEIVLCTPPSEKGLNPAIAFAALTSGIEQIFQIGGSQAIAALTYGTESVTKVDKIFGPGNQFVTAAKQLASLEGVAIDLPAGPSEVLVYADESANPKFVAADLLSQAEHGVDSQVILLSLNIEIVQSVLAEIAVQLEKLPRKEVAKKALNNSKAFLVASENDAINLINEYAPEHLILAIKNYNSVQEKIVNAGSIFLGNYSPESAGDYASGTNHTLPTNGYARAYSGVSLDSFCKKITVQEISKEGLKNIGKVIEIMAEAENLFAHKNAVSIRF